MSNGWDSEFRERMRSFEAAHPGDGPSLSLKVRAPIGCFHREHSPQAFVLIDERLASIPPDERDFDFVEHESGPELLVLAAGLTVAANVINLLTAIIQARHNGVAKGDHPSEPIELIVRRVQTGDTLHEETILRTDQRDAVDPATIEALLDRAIKRLPEHSDGESE